MGGLGAVLEPDAPAGLVDEHPQDEAFALAHVLDVDELQALGSEQRRGELANLLFDVLFV